MVLTAGCNVSRLGRDARKGVAISGIITVVAGAVVYGPVSAIARNTYIVNVEPVATND